MAKQQAYESKATTKTVACSCNNEYQDKKYGTGKRVANYSRKHSVYRCTVCSKSHSA